MCIVIALCTRVCGSYLLVYISVEFMYACMMACQYVLGEGAHVFWGETYTDVKMWDGVKTEEKRKQTLSHWIDGLQKCQKSMWKKNLNSMSKYYLGQFYWYSPKSHITLPQGALNCAHNTKRRKKREKKKKIRKERKEKKEKKVAEGAKGLLSYHTLNRWHHACW